MVTCERTWFLTLIQEFVSSNQQWNNELINVSTQLLNLAKLIPEVNGISCPKRMKRRSNLLHRRRSLYLTSEQILDFKDEKVLWHVWFLTRVGSQSYNVLTRISIFNWGSIAFSRTRRVHWLKAEQSALLPIRPKSWEVKQRWQTVNFNKVIGQNIRSNHYLILGFNSFITLGQIGKHFTQWFNFQKDY